MPRVEQELPRRRVGEIAVRQFGDQQVAEGAGIAQEREPILVARRRGETRLDLARVRKPQPRLAEEVETHVGQRHVLLDDRALADPFAEALREDQWRVAEAQQVVEQLPVIAHRVRIAYRMNGRNACKVEASAGRSEPDAGAAKRGVERVPGARQSVNT